MSAEARQLHQEVHYLAAPQDRVWIASPFAFPPNSPMLAKLVETFVPGPGRMVFMDHVREVVRTHGLEYAFAKPEVCSPLPHLFDVRSRDEWRRRPQLQ